MPCIRHFSLTYDLPLSPPPSWSSPPALSPAGSTSSLDSSSSYDASPVRGARFDAAITTYPLAMPVAPGAMPHNSVRGQQTTLSGLQETFLPRLHVNIAHPYARIHARKDSGKRRRIWNHALEKALFTAQELETMGAPHRRTIYQASLEAHIDRMHAQLIALGYYPVPYEKLAPFKGTNTKIAKSLLAGLQHDESQLKLKLLEIERANASLRGQLEAIEAGPQPGIGQSGRQQNGAEGVARRRHSTAGHQYTGNDVY